MENETELEFLQPPSNNAEPTEDENASDSDEAEFGEGDKDGKNGKDRNDSEDYSGDYGDTSIIEIFMRHDEELLPYPDQAETIEEFCRNTSLRELKSGIVGNCTKCALLDDIKDTGSFVVEREQCRPYIGPLSQYQLYMALAKPRFRVGSGEAVTNDVIEREEKEHDADRRLIYVTNLDRLGILALVATASRSQAPVLRNLIYKYLRFKNSIGVTIPSMGFRTFALDLHIPFYKLRRGMASVNDARQRPDGKPLRQAWDLPRLALLTNPCASAPDDIERLYEAQISFAVAGIDHWTWIAYAFVDTHVDPKESVDDYHEINQKNEGLFRPDPAAAGLVDASKHCWTPREYFLQVFEIRIKQVLKEWHGIVDRLQDTFNQVNYVFTEGIIDHRISDQVQRFSSWNTKMVEILRLLLNCLAETVSAWEGFQRREIGYFYPDNNSPSDSRPMPDRKLSLESIDKAYSELRILQFKLQALRTQLVVDNRQAVTSHFSFENREFTIFQQKTAGHVKVLTVITIFFFPLILTQGLFSTQGVLPFTPNLGYFMYALLVSTVLVVVTSVILFNWESWCQLLVRWVKRELHHRKQMFTRGKFKDEENQID